MRKSIVAKTLNRLKAYHGKVGTFDISDTIRWCKQLMKLIAGDLTMLLPLLYSLLCSSSLAWGKGCARPRARSARLGSQDVKPCPRTAENRANSCSCEHHPSKFTHCLIQDYNDSNNYCSICIKTEMLDKIDTKSDLKVKSCFTGPSLDGKRNNLGTEESTTERTQFPESLSPSTSKGSTDKQNEQIPEATESNTRKEDSGKIMQIILVSSLSLVMVVVVAGVWRCRRKAFLETTRKTDHNNDYGAAEDEEDYVATEVKDENDMYGMVDGKGRGSARTQIKDNNPDYE